MSGVRRNTVGDLFIARGGVAVPAAGCARRPGRSASAWRHLGRKGLTCYVFLYASFLANLTSVAQQNSCIEHLNNKLVEAPVGRWCSTGFRAKYQRLDSWLALETAGVYRVFSHLVASARVRCSRVWPQRRRARRGPRVGPSADSRSHAPSKVLHNSNRKC